MYWKGVKCRRANHYGWRYPIPGDVNLSGNQVKDQYVVLVKKDDCIFYTDEQDRKRYDPKGAKQSVIMNHGGTGYGYGKARKKMGWVHRETGQRYPDGPDVPDGPERGIIGYTTPFYIVKDGHVWQGSIFNDDVIECPSCGEPGREHQFDNKDPMPEIKTDDDYNTWWKENRGKVKCPKCGYDWEEKVVV